MAWYVLLVVAVALERLAELSRRNLAGVEPAAASSSVRVITR
jgi:hypothetical protein